MELKCRDLMPSLSTTFPTLMTSAREVMCVASDWYTRCLRISVCGSLFDEIGPWLSVLGHDASSNSAPDVSLVAKQAGVSCGVNISVEMRSRGMIDDTVGKCECDCKSCSQHHCVTRL